MKTVTKYVTSGIIAVSLAGTGLAFTRTAQLMPLQPQAHSPQMLVLQKSRQTFKHSFTGSWAIALHRTKQLTSAEAKTVADAAVILYGDSSMKVGKITAVPGKKDHQNYQVQITNQDGKVLNTFTMNGVNGNLMKLKHATAKMAILAPASPASK